MHMIANDCESNENSNQFRNKKWVDDRTADSKEKKETSDKDQVVIFFGEGRRQSAAERHVYGQGFLVRSPLV